MGPISSRSDCEAARGARSFRKDAGIYLMRLHESTRVAIDQTNNTIAISCVYGGRPRGKRKLELVPANLKRKGHLSGELSGPQPFNRILWF